LIDNPHAIYYIKLIETHSIVFIFPDDKVTKKQRNINFRDFFPCLVQRKKRIFKQTKNGSKGIDSSEASFVLVFVLNIILFFNSILTTEVARIDTNKKILETHLRNRTTLPKTSYKFTRNKLEPSPSRFDFAFFFVSSKKRVKVKQQKVFS